MADVDTATYRRRGIAGGVLAVLAALLFWPNLILLTVGLACSLVIRQVLSTVNLE